MTLIINPFSTPVKTPEEVAEWEQEVEAWREKSIQELEPTGYFGEGGYAGAKARAGFGRRSSQAQQYALQELQESQRRTTARDKAQAEKIRLAEQRERDIQASLDFERRERQSKSQREAEEQARSYLELQQRESGGASVSSGFLADLKVRAEEKTSAGVYTPQALKSQATLKKISQEVTYEEQPLEQTFIQSLIGGYRKAEEKTSEFIAPVFDFVEKKTGLDIAEFSSLAGETAPTFFNPLGTSLGFFQPESTKQFQAGITEGIIVDIKEKPLKQVALFGAGYVGGFALKGITTGLGAISPMTGMAGKTIITGGGLVLGGGFALKKGQEIISAPSPRERGRLTGITLKDLGLIGAGVSSGEKGFVQLKGK